MLTVRLELVETANFSGTFEERAEALSGESAGGQAFVS